MTDADQTTELLYNMFFALGSAMVASGQIKAFEVFTDTFESLTASMPPSTTRERFKGAIDAQRSIIKRVLG